LKGKGKTKATVTTDAERLEALEEKLDEVLQHVRMQTDVVDALVEGMTNLRGKVAQMENTIVEKLSYNRSNNE
jgi:peptidoglycan hydrolase CwlO-like protein